MQKGDRVRLLNVGGASLRDRASSGGIGTAAQVQAGPMKMTVKENELAPRRGEKKNAPKPAAAAA